MQTSKLRAIAAASIALVTCVAILAPSTADARKRKKGTIVTIVVNGGDFSGSVRNKKAECVAEREVGVFRQAGTTPNPGTDTQIASDTTAANGQWNTGNTGANDGRYYAFAAATLTPVCKAGTSRTVTVTGRPEEPEI